MNFKQEINKIFKDIENKTQYEYHNACELWAIQTEFCSLYSALVEKWERGVPDQFKWKHPINGSIETMCLLIAEVATYDEDVLIDTKEKLKWLKGLYKQCHAQALINVKDGIECGWGISDFCERADKLCEERGGNNPLPDLTNKGGNKNGAFLKQKGSQN